LGEKLDSPELYRNHHLSHRFALDEKHRGDFDLSESLHPNRGISALHPFPPIHQKSLAQKKITTYTKKMFIRLGWACPPLVDLSALGGRSSDFGIMENEVKIFLGN